MTAVVIGLTGQSAIAQWSLNGAEAYYNSGNVGVGTSNPAYTLDVRTANSRAIFAWAKAGSGTTYGVYGRSESTGGRGVVGYAASPTGTTIGVYGKAISPNGYAGYFSGNVGVSGWIGTKSEAPVELRSNDRPVLRLQWASNGALEGPNIIAGNELNNISDGVYGATIAGGGRNDDPNSITAEFGTVGGGFGNSAGEHAVVGGGHYNVASGHGAAINGGNLNNATATGAAIGGGYENNASGQQSTVAGGYVNTAGANWATVGGGEDNSATGIYSTISGGASNFATDNDCTVGGGVGNTAGNGGWNTTDSTHATVAGGSDNTAAAFAASVGGGKLNVASAWYSTVPGGHQNSASGTYSFAAGRRANAGHSGAFVWGDSTNADVLSSANNQFLARASGGVKFFNSAGVGVELAAGGNSWSAMCDRNLKTNITPIDPREVLAKLMTVPISQWNLISQDESIRHLGPMAQDFHAAFGLGEDNRRITQIDADGVALAAIQGLHQLVMEQLAQLRSKDEEIAALRANIGDLADRLARLESGLASIAVLNGTSP